MLKREQIDTSKKSFEFHMENCRVLRTCKQLVTLALNDAYEYFASNGFLKFH